jgi:aspartyl-tRNA synthetase
LYDIEIEIPTSFPRIEFGRAVEILEQEYWLKTEKGADISSEWEKLIAEYVKKKWNSDFVFLIDYPIEVRPFYHMRDSETNITKSFDLLYKWLEITTWAQREHRYDVLKEQAIQKMWSIESIDFYLNFFKHWMPAHWWLWFGRVRFFTKMFGFDNIREMTFLPRDPKRITP